ncbi:MAG TPA: cupredoxin domain-containing protein [Candidatus Polarisedimenticolia bacterium]|nr:cupredoxin domain-containing protein [Candidatus Polarisedimenticolia bacterium]
MTRSTLVARLLALAVVAAIPAACGADQPTGSPTPAPSGVVAITASEFKYDPSTLTVPAGDVRFAVRNGGNIEHEFEIFKDGSVVDELEGIVPGLTKELMVTLGPGEYTYVCKLAGHEEQGMKGTLTVN